MPGTDSWGETAPLPPVDEEYQGRRRRGLQRVASRPGRAGWLVVLGVMLSLSAAVAVPFIINGSGPDRELTSDGTQPGGPGPRTSLSPFGSGLVIVPAPSETPTPTAAASTSLPATTTSAAATTTTTTSPTAPPFTPFTVQAEQAGSSGSGCSSAAPCTAWGGRAGPPSNFAGGRGVDEIGDDWIRGDGRNNWLEFRNVNVPVAHQYRLRIWYVYALGPTGTRRMDVIVNQVTVSTQQFSTTLQISSRDVTVPLVAGNNTIRFTHQFDRCPAIDRIEILSL